MFQCSSESWIQKNPDIWILTYIWGCYGPPKQCKKFSGTPCIRYFYPEVRENVWKSNHLDVITGSLTRDDWPSVSARVLLMSMNRLVRAGNGGEPLEWKIHRHQQQSLLSCSANSIFAKFLQNNIRILPLSLNSLCIISWTWHCRLTLTGRWQCPLRCDRVHNVSPHRCFHRRRVGDTWGAHGETPSHAVREDYISSNIRGTERSGHHYCHPTVLFTSKNKSFFPISNVRHLHTRVTTLCWSQRISYKSQPTPIMMSLFNYELKHPMASTEKQRPDGKISHQPSSQHQHPRELSWPAETRAWILSSKF